MQNDIFTKHFYFHRAIQQVEFVTADNQENLVVFNTHLDAWASGTGLLDSQVSLLESLIRQQEKVGKPWVLGGDFNLLPPDGGKQRQQLADNNTGSYNENTAIKGLYESYNAIPPLSQLTSAEVEKWYTHFPNHPEVTQPDRTIDYLFSSKILVTKEGYVRQKDTWRISDHLPVVGVYQQY